MDDLDRKQAKEHEKQTKVHAFTACYDTGVHRCSTKTCGSACVRTYLNANEQFAPYA